LKNINRDALRAQLHSYAEDREIDYTAAQYLVEAFGGRWNDQAELIQFKQIVDNYLKEYHEDQFEKIVNAVEILCNEKKEEPKYKGLNKADKESSVKDKNGKRIDTKEKEDPSDKHTRPFKKTSK
jgi:hypothetical protein